MKKTLLEKVKEVPGIRKYDNNNVLDQFENEELLQLVKAYLDRTVSIGQIMRALGQEKSGGNFYSYFNTIIKRLYRTDLIKFKQ